MLDMVGPPLLFKQLAKGGVLIRKALGFGLLAMRLLSVHTLVTYV